FVDRMDEFSFPYPPYPIQLDLMRELDTCLENKKTGIFESPTGTGKSLSVLCATLSWLEKYNKTEEERLKNILNEKDEAEGEKDWMLAYKKKKEQNILKDDARNEMEKRDKVKEKIRKAEERREENKKRGRREKKEEDEDDDCVVEDEIEVDQEKEEEEPITCKKIFYASRTHSQLDQILQELGKTRFRPRVVSLFSRSILCVNEDVLALKTNSLINERCMELRKKTATKREPGKKSARLTACSCDYYKADAIEALTNEIISCRLTNASEVVKEGKESLACPYFASRRSIPLAELVLLPYQVLLHEKTRSSWGIDIKDNVVIIDEAHNVIQTIGSLYTSELTLPTLTAALSLLRQYCDQFRLRLSARNLANIRLFITFVASLEAFLRNVKSASTLKIEEIILKCNLVDISLFSISDYMEKVDLCRKMHGFYLRSMRGILKERQEKSTGVAALLKKKKEEVAPPPSPTVSPPQRVGSPLFTIKSFLDSLLNPCEDGRILVEPGKSLKFILLNPGARLQSLVSLTHSSLLVGGTMEPAGVLIAALTYKSPSSEISRFSCSHVVPNENVMAMVIGCGSNGQRLELKMENRGNEQVLSSLCSSLLSLTRLSPSGSVIFFPSYSFLNTFIAYCEKTKVMKEFESIKSLFIEKQGAQDASKLLVDYSRAARSTKGALLLAVMGGRLSEGINFNDELGRSVIIVGLPYANRGSIELQERMKYLDGQRSGRGNELYESLCWHAVNQAVGRALRHRNDWASIILVDYRFMSAGEGKISSWLFPRITRPKSWNEITANLISFYESKK
ncbi:chl-1, partial [Pristionchus pacificus]